MTCPMKKPTTTSPGPVEGPVRVPLDEHTQRAVNALESVLEAIRCGDAMPVKFVDGIADSSTQRPVNGLDRELFVTVFYPQKPLKAQP